MDITSTSSQLVERLKKAREEKARKLQEDATAMEKTADVVPPVKPASEKISEVGAPLVSESPSKKQRTEGGLAPPKLPTDSTFKMKSTTPIKKGGIALIPAGGRFKEGSNLTKKKLPATKKLVEKGRMNIGDLTQELVEDLLQGAKGQTLPNLQAESLRADTIAAIDAEQRLRSEAQIQAAGVEAEKSRGSATPRVSKDAAEKRGMTPQVQQMEEGATTEVELDKFVESLLSGEEVELEMQGSRQMSDASRGSDSTPGTQSRRGESAAEGAVMMGQTLALGAGQPSSDKQKRPEFTLRTEKSVLSPSEVAKVGAFLRGKAGAEDQTFNKPGTLPIGAIQQIDSGKQPVGGQVGGMEVSTQHPAATASDLPFGQEQIKSLKRLIDQYFKSNITGGWSASAFKERLDAAMGGQDILNKKWEELNKAQQDLDRKMEESMKTLQAERDKLRKEAKKEEEAAAARAKLFEILQGEVNSALSKYEFVEGEGIKLGTELEEYKKAQLKDQTGILARLEGLEGSRREERARTGVENVPESNRLRMEGGEMMLHAIISRGVFPNVLTEDPSFMRLIRDKEGFLLALEKADAQRRLQGEHRRLTERHLSYRGPGDTEDRSNQGRKEAQGESSRPRR